MGLKFAKKSTPVDDDEGNVATKTPPKKTEHSAPKAGWLKSGKEAKAALETEEALAEQRKEEQGKLWPFWLPPDEERQITFLDGKLDEDGMLDVLMYYEHSVKINGKWQKFVCTAEADTSQPCPLCESGNRNTLVGVLTVIDHSEYKVKNGPNAGKTIKNTRKLFPAKRATLKLLQNIAAKRGGLAGCTIDVYRSGDKAAGVGDQFQFVEKLEKRSEIAAKYDLELDDVKPADYTEEITYRSPEELIALGVCKPAIHQGTGSSSNFDDEL